MGLFALQIACYFFVFPPLACWLPAAAAAGAALGHGSGLDGHILGVAASVLLIVGRVVDIAADQHLRVFLTHVPPASALDLATADDLDRAIRVADPESEGDGVAHHHVLAGGRVAGLDMLDGGPS